MGATFVSWRTAAHIGSNGGGEHVKIARGRKFGNTFTFTRHHTEKHS